MLDQAAIEQAVYTWVKDSTAVPLVYWGDQNLTQARNFPYATLRLGDDAPQGPFEQLESIDLGQAAGSEIGLTALQQLELVVSVQMWTAGSTGGNNARALLRKARLALGLESVRSLLAVAGLSLLDPGRIANLSGIFGTDSVGRASLDVRFLVAEDVTERIGWIETVNGTGTIDETPYPYTAGG